MENTKRSRADWLALARAWEASGLSQRRFCDEHGLKPAAFGYWRTRYLREQASAGGFVALKPESAVEVVKLRLSGLEVELAGGADFVTEVLVKLAGRC